VARSGVTAVSPIRIVGDLQVAAEHIARRILRRGRRFAGAAHAVSDLQVAGCAEVLPHQNLFVNCTGRACLHAAVTIAVEARRRIAHDSGAGIRVIAGHGAIAILECNDGGFSSGLLSHDIAHARAVNHLLAGHYNLQQQAGDDEGNRRIEQRKAPCVSAG